MLGWLDVVWSYVMDSGGMASVDDMHRAAEEALLEDPSPNRDTWGLGPKAEAGQRAMMDLFAPAQ